MPLRVTLAGQLAIDGDGVAVDMTSLGRLGRFFSAYLVCERHRPIAKDELAEALWGDEQLPRSWEQMLRGSASKVRAALAAAGLDTTVSVVSAFSAYQLRLPGEAVVDVEEAASALDHAEAALAAGDAAAAHHCASAAAAVVVKGFFPGWSGMWVERHQTALRQLHLRALDTVAQAALIERRWTEAVAAAEESVSLEPFRERAYQTLIAAHRGAGNPAEALRQYERCRRVLAALCNPDQRGAPSSALRRSRSHPATAATSKATTYRPPGRRSSLERAKTSLRCRRQGPPVASHRADRTRSLSCPASNGKRGPPAVRGSLLLGSARELRKDPLGTYRRAMEAHGDVARFRVGPPRVGFEFDAVFRPEGARQVLATEFGQYRKDAPVFKEMTRLLGEGLLTSEGDRWRRDRRIVQPLFTRRRVGAYVSLIDAAANDLVASWKDDAHAGRPIDLHDSAMRYALDALGRAVLGDDVAGARPVLTEAIPLLSEHAVRRGLSILRLPPSLPTRANRLAARAQAAIYALVDGIIARGRSGERSGDDLLSLLLTARDPEGGTGIDDRGVRDQALIFVLGGHETTGSALAFTLQLLASHDDVQERARAEATAVLGEASPTAEDVDRLRYTTQVVNEALRLYPPGHTLVRTAVEGSMLFGHEVPKGRILALSIWGIHHNPSVWPDPERFDPDRFHLPESGDAPAQQDRYAHLPFGGGPRACIGAHLAMTELVIVVAAILRTYRLHAVMDEPKLDVALTLRPLGALPCRVVPLGGQG